MNDPNLITSYNFQGHPFLIKMNVINGYLELVLTDKQSGEEWECSYDSSYIESVTRKTGNFKQFEIFMTMLKSGLLKTSDCITLDLLTFEDLESMRVRRLRNHSTNRLSSNNNRRYLILTYSVEFDKINYPLPLEYCGPPDPVILQTTIRRLEADLSRANEELSHTTGERHKIHVLQKRIEKLTAENLHLNDEVKRLTKMINDGGKKPKTQVQILQRAIMELERNVKFERNSHHRLVEKLQNDKMQLMNQLEKLKVSGRTSKSKLQHTQSRSPLRTKQNKPQFNTQPYISKSQEVNNVRHIYQRKKSPFTKTAHASIRIQRSRSASPQMIIQEHFWQQQLPKNHRSRSSSASSKKGLFNIDVYTPQQSRKPSPQHSRKPSPAYSRRASPSSYNDSFDSHSNSSAVHVDAYKKRNTSPAYTRSSSANVKELEARVRKLFQN